MNKHAAVAILATALLNGCAVVRVQNDNTNTNTNTNDQRTGIVGAGGRLGLGAEGTATAAGRTTPTRTIRQEGGRLPIRIIEIP